MLFIDNIKIYKLDEYNYSYEYLAEVEKKTGEKVMEWKPSRSYFGNLKQCLNSIKDKLVKDKIHSKDMSVDDLISYLNKLKNEYENCKLISKEPRKKKNDEEI